MRALRKVVHFKGGMRRDTLRMTKRAGVSAEGWMADQPEVSLERHAQVWLETAGGHGLGSGDGKTPKTVYRKADRKGPGTAGGQTPCREEEEKVR